MQKVVYFRIARRCWIRSARLRDRSSAVDHCNSAEHEPDVGMTVKYLHRSVQKVWSVAVIRIDARHILAPRGVETFRDRVCRTQVFPMPDEPNARVVECCNHICTAVRRCIVNHDDLVIMITLLAEDAIQTVGDKGLHVVYGHDEADLGGGFAHQTGSR